MPRTPALAALAVLLPFVAAYAQGADVQQVLDALRADIATQEKAAAVLAWSADARTTLGVGDQRRRFGEARLCVVRELRRNGRVHVWFDPATMYWSTRDTFVWEAGQAVTDGKRSAQLLERHGVEGGSEARAEGRIEPGPQGTEHLLARAGAGATTWRFGGQPVSALLRDVEAGSVRLKGDEVVVEIPGGGGRHVTLRFQQREGSFALREYRETIAGKVHSSQALEVDRVAGKLWFPRRITIDSDHRGEPMQIAIEITAVALDPQLAPGTFTITAPPRTPFTVEQKPVEVTAANPDLFGLVKLQTDANPRVTPPTPLPPERR